MKDRERIPIEHGLAEIERYAISLSDTHDLKVLVAINIHVEGIRRLLTGAHTAASHGRKPRRKPAEPAPADA